MIWFQESQGLDAVASWEASTDKRIVANQLNLLIAEMRAKRAAELDTRREKLAYVLHTEEMALQQELVDSAESPEERRAKLAFRARKLAAGREEERRALKAQLEERHFRENCDPLRERLSQKVLYQTIGDRNKQVGQYIPHTNAELHQPWMPFVL